MITVFGTDLCPDCVEAKKILDEAKVEYTYKSFSDSIQNIKEFLKFRDGLDMFEPVKSAGGVGIPFIVTSDGKYFFDVEEALKNEDLA